MAWHTTPFKLIHVAGCRVRRASTHQTRSHAVGKTGRFPIERFFDGILLDPFSSSYRQSDRFFQVFFYVIL